MKRIFTSNLFKLQLLGKASIICLVVCLCNVALLAQNTTGGNEFGDLSNILWKASPDVNASIAFEQSRMAVALSAPSVAPDEKALYKAYERVLYHVQVEVQGGKTVGEAIEVAYKNVLVEALSDPNLKNMPDGLLATYIPGLIEALQETPKAIPAN